MLLSLFIGGTLSGSILTVILYYFLQKSTFQSQVQSAKNLIAQAKLRSQILVLKAESEYATQKNLLESRAARDHDTIIEEENHLKLLEEHLQTKTNLIQEQKKLLGTDREQVMSKKTNLQVALSKQTQALESKAQIAAKELWQKYLDNFLNEEETLQQKYLEKVIVSTTDQVEQKAKSIMNVIHQRYNGESTRDPTLIEITFSPKEFERIVGDEQMSKIIHLQTALGSELKLEYKADHTIRVFGYDLWRRYIIKGALERMKKNPKLVLADALTETQKFTEQRMFRIGKKACDYLGIKDFPPELIKLVGRLDYRTSFGQNIYRHSIEVAVLGKMIAEEIGCDPYICIVGGLLHDIGKGVDADIAGGHDAIGRDIALEYHLHPDIVHSIFAHHELEPYRSVEARVVQLADAISAARPGARHHEPLEEYIARMKALEEAAIKQIGVEKAFVMQAGREIRAFVDPEKTSDDGAHAIAKLIVTAVQESNAVRSGEVKIQVIRELTVNAYSGKRKTKTYRAKR